MKAPTKQLQSSEDGIGAGSVYLFISLYVVVLAFFILLNSISERDHTRSQRVVKSVYKTFYPKKRAHSTPGDSAQHSGGDQMTPDAFHEELSDAFDIFGSRVLHKGNVMYVSIPEKQFFESNSPNIRDINKPLLKRLQEITSKDYGGARVDMEFLVSSRDYLQDSFLRNTRLDVQRAGMFAREMEKIGTDPKTIVVGVQKGESQNIMISFYFRSIDESKRDVLSR